MPERRDQKELRPSITITAKGKPFEIFCCQGTKVSAATLRALQHICLLLAEQQ